MTQVVELYLNYHMHFTLSRTQLACLNIYVNAMLIPYLIEPAVNIFKLTHFIKGNLNAP